MAPVSQAATKRGPSVLVTDSRERPPAQSRPSQLLSRQHSRFITVDSVLQYASDIPSMQARSPSVRPRPARSGSGRPADPKLAGRMIPQPVPARSTKISEKLVLLPETEPDDDEIGEKEDFEADNDARPLRDDEEIRRRKGGRPGKSYAERLPKARRAEKLARVTAYCTAQAYKLKYTAAFLRDHHAARTKLYDDCLYTVYHLPLLPGTEGYRLRSSPLKRGPSGKAVLDEAIERSERRDYGEGFFEEDGVAEERFEVRGNEPNEHEVRHSDESPNRENDTDIQEGNHSYRSHEDRKDDVGSRRERPASPGLSNALTFGELFIFSYGVVVFWNFTERQEKDIMADLTFSESDTGLPLADRALNEEDFETEEFHFEYSHATPRPRLFNDMITLRSGDHMIKLSMSHAIAQSTKLSFFEQRMANQMVEAQHVPKRLALTGKLGLKREEVVKILGALFKSRVDVNLSSNMLDVPNFFWDSEPTLHPLYFAVREYLEIKPRIQVLNERCRVFLDLAEILSDSIADNKMSRLTWIIIILIILSIFVTCFEVFLRFGILTKERSGSSGKVLPMCISPASGELRL